MSNRTKLIALIVAIAVAVAAIVAANQNGWTDSDEIERLLTETGIWGPIVFVLIMWFFQPIGIPGVVFMIPAALTWPLPLAMGLSWIGNMGASIIAFSFARWIGHDWAQEHIPAGMKKWQDRVDENAVMPVFLLRLVTGMLPPADWLLGLSKVRFRPFLIGTALGIIPGIVLNVTVGASLFTLLREHRLVLWGLILLFVVVNRTRIYRRNKAARTAAAGSVPTEPGAQTIEPVDE